MILCSVTSGSGTLKSIQQREEDWVLADLVGKAKHVRTGPIPSA